MSEAQIDEIVGALRAMTKAVGELPENANGSIQGADLNRAYSEACRILERLEPTPNEEGA